VRRCPNVLTVVEHLRDAHVIGVELVDLDFEKVPWVAQMSAQTRRHFVERAEQGRKSRAVSAQDRIRWIDDVEAYIAFIGIDYNLHRVTNVTEFIVGWLGIGKSVSDGIGILYPEQSPLVDNKIRIAIQFQEGCTPRNTLLDRSPQLDAALW